MKMGMWCGSGRRYLLGEMKNERKGTTRVVGSLDYPKEEA